MVICRAVLRFRGNKKHIHHLYNISTIQIYYYPYIFNCTYKQTFYLIYTFAAAIVWLNDEISALIAASTLQGITSYSPMYFVHTYCTITLIVKLIVIFLLHKFSLSSFKKCFIKRFIRSTYILGYIQSTYMVWSTIFALSWLITFFY